jgi:hypothetical protein
MGDGLLKSGNGLHFEVLPPATRRAFSVFSKVVWLKKDRWYLAGGTSLALQVGHRSSVDLDFFTRQKDFDQTELENKLLALGDWHTDRSDEGTMYGTLRKAKVSFIAYPFFHPSTSKFHYEHISLLKPDDIAVMKIIAISQRGRKRDFIDLYWYCNLGGGDLEATFRRMVRQYPQKHNMIHILKSLDYFDNAEKDPMPQLYFTTDWAKVKAYFRNEAPRITRKLIDLE